MDIKNIYVCGDTHGNIDMQKIYQWKPITSNNLLIVAGDWEAIYYQKSSSKWARDNKIQRQWLKYGKELDFELLVVDGNHENHTMLLDLPIIERYGGRVREFKVQRSFKNSQVLGSIYIAIRGEIYIINGKKILTIGGAESQDKESRIWNVSWWSEELLSNIDVTNTLNNLDKHNWKVDYVVTHTCPTYISHKIASSLWGGMYNGNYQNYITKKADPVGNFLQFLYDEGLEAEEHHFGHWHIDGNYFLDDKSTMFYCHYNKPPMVLI